MDPGIAWLQFKGLAVFIQKLDGGLVTRFVGHIVHLTIAED